MFSAINIHSFMQLRCILDVHCIFSLVEMSLCGLSICKTLKTAKVQSLAVAISSIFGSLNAFHIYKILYEHNTDLRFVGVIKE